MKKRLFAVFAAFCILSLLLCACNKKEQQPTPEPSSAVCRTITFPTAEGIGAAVSSLEKNAEKENGPDYDEAQPMSEEVVYVTLADGNTVVTDENGDPYMDGYADVSGNTLHIRKAGTYDLTGSLSDGQIIVGTDDRVQLLFRGVTIACSDRPAIEIYGTGKKVITLARGSVNRLSDGAERADSTKDGVIRAAHAVTVDGKGSLEIAAKFGSAIHADAVKVIDSTLTVSEAKNSAIRSGAFLLLSHANVTVNCQGYSLLAADEVILSGSTLSARGGIGARDFFADGSTIDLVSYEDGICAMRLISAQNSSLDIDAEGDGLRAIGEDATAVDGIVRLYECKTVVTDGDDGIRARYFSFSGGNLFCVGMGTQLCVTEGAVCSWNIDEILLPDGIAAGSKLQLGNINVTLKRKGRIVVSVYAQPYDQIELRVDDKPILGFANVE